jgi:D-alanine-D-alanine ligase
MKKNIAVVTGGDSSELVISLKSAEQVIEHLDAVKYEPYLVFIKGEDWHVRSQVGQILHPSEQERKQPGADPAFEKIPVNREDFSFEKDGRKIRFDYAFIAMHGPPGENGQLQAYFDQRGISYSTSGVKSLELSFNKHETKVFLENKGIRTAEWILVRMEPGTNVKTMVDEAGREEPFDPVLVMRRMGLPCFVKPNAGGSSFGVSRINRIEDLGPAIEKALAEDDEVLVEKFVTGTELTCGVFKSPSREFLFPVTEIVSKNEFFDYEAKYTPGAADEITPARISGELAGKCHSISSTIYDLLDCRGIVRIDFIEEDGELVFLELNGIPGMSRESIVPKQIRAMGLTEAGIYNLIIEETANW